MFRLLLVICFVIGIVSAEISEKENVREKRNSAVKCGTPYEASGYISGGVEVKRGQYPWLV